MKNYNLTWEDIETKKIIYDNTRMIKLDIGAYVFKIKFPIILK
jgi:hypothetical protein